MMLLGRRSGLLPGQDCCGEHAQRQRGEAQAGLHRALYPLELQEDRQRDHGAAQRDLLQHLLGDPEAEVGKPNRPGSSRVSLPWRLRRTSQ